MLNQKDGVFSAVCEVFGQDSFDSKLEYTKDQAHEVCEIVTIGLMDGTISMSTEAKAKYDDHTKMRQYAGGLVANWFRKDLRLNGGEVYEIKSPGSRAGSGDPVLKELRKLKKAVTPAQAEAVQEEIDKRLALIQTKKSADVIINTDLIPEELRHLVNQD